MKLSRKIGLSQGGALAVVLACGSAAPALADFAYTDFTTTPNLAFNGSAAQSSPSLSVTPPIRSSAGSVWHTAPQTIVDGFVSNFTFRISDISGGGSDGFAFVIHNDAAGTSAIGGAGGALGYATNTAFPSQVGIANGIAIEFDTWDNTFNWADFNSDHHVSIQSMGPLSMIPSGLTSLGAAVTPTNFADNTVHTVRVVYASNTLEVYLDNLVTPLVSTSVNLNSLLTLNSGQAYVGFTGGTGAFQDAERHEVLSWDFNVTQAPTPAAASLLAAGGGLLLGRRRRSR